MGSERITAINVISMDIPKGELVVILGPSGSGKTTPLNLVGGLESVDSGQILMDQQDLTELSETVLVNYRHFQVGLVFQFFNLGDVSKSVGV
ncbi:MAG: ATP-binding cassette domain-containing protein [Anaerolineaceae bacterium]|nr:ATP-binding cassette domain-containing protein [Anaerolineaceae bacterium]